MIKRTYGKAFSALLAFLMIFSFAITAFAADEDFNAETGVYTVPDGTEEIKKNTVSLKEHSLSEIKKIVFPESVETVKKDALNLDELTSLKEIMIKKEKGTVFFEEGAIPKNDSRIEGLVVSYKIDEPLINPDLKPEKKPVETPKKRGPENLPKSFTGEIKTVSNTEDKEKKKHDREIVVPKGTKKGRTISITVTVAVAVSVIVIGIMKFRPSLSY